MVDLANLYTGKKVLVFGVANERSIAWGIVKAMHAAGAEIAFTYAGEALEKRVRPLAASLGSTFVEPCDVTKDEELDAVFDKIGATWGELDVLIHAVAFANREDLEGRYLDTSREGFRLAHDISAYSLVAMTKRAMPYLKKKQGTVLAMTYYGAEKVVPNYNVMGVAKASLEASVRYLAADVGPEGVRVNAISAGPIKTLAAGGIKGFKSILEYVANRSPLRSNVTQEDVGKTALYLCSDLSSGVTGEVVYVDAGYSIMGG